MRAVAVFPRQCEVRVINNHPEPQLEAAGQVKLRMLEVGVCGTDREIVAFDYGTPPAESDYLVIGHESLGEVVEVGDDVPGVKTGDLAVTTVRRPCDVPSCVACRAGRQDFCYTGQFTERGIKERHGYMTEYVVDEAKYMHVVPHEMREIAVLVEPLTIAEKALMQLDEIQQRLPWACERNAEKRRQHCHRAVVLGAGPVGLLGAMALLNDGFEVWVYSRESSDSAGGKVMAQVGGHYISSSEVAVADLPRHVGNIDVVYEAVGASSFAFEVLKVLGTNGVFIFTGVPDRKGPFQVDTDKIMRQMVLQNQIAYGTVNAGPAAFDAAVKDLTSFYKQWPDAVRGLITSRVSMEDAIPLLQNRGPGIKNVVQIAQ